jgi:hypothetical protein
LVLVLSIGILAETPDLRPLTNRDLIQAARTGLQAEDLQRLVRTSRAVRFNLIPAETDKLEKEGVSQDTIKMMAARDKMGVFLRPSQVRPPLRRTRLALVFSSPTALTPGLVRVRIRKRQKSSKRSPRERQNATVTNDRLKANYVVRLERESQKVIRHENKMVIFDKAGDVVYAASAQALGNAVRNVAAISNK